LWSLGGVRNDLLAVEAVNTEWLPVIDSNATVYLRRGVGI